MSNESFMIGTKFYNTIGDSEVPDIIRLTKQAGNRLYFNDGGYRTTIFKEDFDTMIRSSEMKQEKDNVYIRAIPYFDKPVYQKWTALNSTTDRFIKFNIQALKMSMLIQELKDNYIRLVPDGFMTFSNIQYPIGDDNCEDVLITLHNKTSKLPYAICRQNSVDIFSYSNNSMMIPIGISISKKTCPSNMNFMDFLYSEKVLNFKSTAIYMDDSINAILKLIGSTNKYNVVLRKLEDGYYGTQMVGCQSNIYDLIKHTGFMDDFRSMFDIHYYPFAINRNKDELSETDLLVFNKAYDTDFNSVSYCPYSKDIDLDKVSSKHMIVDTSHEKDTDLYLFMYD